MALKLNSGIAEKRLVSNILYLMVVQFVNYLLPLMTLPFLTKMLSIDDFGKVVLMYSISTIALVVSEYGFNVTGPYYVAKNIQNINRLTVFFSNVVVVKFLVSLVFCFLFIFINYVWVIYNYSASELLAIAFLILTQAFQFSWYFQGVEKMKEITKASVLSKIFYFISIMFVVPFFKNALSVILLYMMSQIVLATLYQKYLKNENIIFKKKYIKLAEIKNIFLSNVEFFISRLAVLGYTMFNSMIIGVHEGMRVVAIYGVAEKVYQVIIGLLSPITQAFYPYMIKNRKFILFFYFLVIGSISLSVGCFILACIDDVVINRIFGPDYNGVGEILNYLYFLILVVFLSVNLGHPLLGAIGKLKQVNYTVYLGFAVFVILYLCRDYSLQVLLENMIVSEFLVFLARLIYVLFAIKENDFKKV